MPQSNLLHTGYLYMQITQNQALQQDGNFKLIQKIKKIREKKFLISQTTLKKKKNQILHCNWACVLQWAFN